MILIRGMIDGMKPKPRMSISDWADAKRFLPPTTTAVAGNYQTSLTPYLEEIMYHLSLLSTVSEVIFMKASQIGGSEVGNNWIGYTIDIDPGPMLMVQPTLSLAERYSKSRIQPMIDNCPDLLKKVKPARSRDSGNTILEKLFPAGIWIGTGANSAAGLRSMPIQKLMLDEIDSYPVDLEDEGNPIDLAEARQRTYKYSKKTFKLSTPTTEGKSIIAKEFETTDQRYYHVPCPDCGGMQHLKFERLKYDYNPNSQKVKDVFYECEHCGFLIDEMKYKTSMLKNGKWEALKPENTNPKRVGYHLNSLYSPAAWFGWDDVCIKYEKAKTDAAKMKTFENTVLGITSKEAGDVPEWQVLYGKREPYEIGKVPDNVYFLTAGVDIQKDRIELEVVGWGIGRQSWSVEYSTLIGTTSGTGSKIWASLGEILNKVYIRDDGVELPISMTCVDHSYNATEVNTFCKKFGTTRAIPIIGKASQTQIIASPKAVAVNKKNKAIGKGKVWQVGINRVKSELFGWLNLEKDEEGKFPEGYCHFPQGYGEEYFQGLASERPVPEIDRNGYRIYTWKKFFNRNEPLDCRVYARAAASYFGMDNWTNERWTQIGGSNAPKIPVPQAEKKINQKPAPAPKKKSNFLGGKNIKF